MRNSQIHTSLARYVTAQEKWAVTQEGVALSVVPATFPGMDDGTSATRFDDPALADQFDPPALDDEFGHPALADEFDPPALADEFDHPALDDQLTDPALVGRFVVRVRRRADVSQRDLAARVNVSPSTVARLESGKGLPSLPLLSHLLAVGGLRLAVVDAQGVEVRPVSADSVRDNQGRRFPAHLDVAPPDEVPSERALRPRYDRPEARGWFRHRAERDRRAEEAPWRDRPTDHPTNDELERRRRLIQGRQPRVEAPPVADVDCTCFDACFEGLCLPTCPCQCEPRLDRFSALARGRLASVRDIASDVSPDGATHGTTAAEGSSSGE